jgi:hypothetical protein
LPEASSHRFQGITAGEEKVMQQKSQVLVRCQWVTPVILATQEAEIRRIMV